MLKYHSAIYPVWRSLQQQTFDQGVQSVSPTVKRASITDANNYGKPVSSISQAAYDSIRSHNDKLALENELKKL